MALTFARNSGIILQGGPLTVKNMQLPQRFQLVSGLSSLDAGVRLILFGAGLAAGTILSANVVKRAKVPAAHVYAVVAGALLQILGFALLATSGSFVDIPPRRLCVPSHCRPWLRYKLSDTYPDYSPCDGKA